MTYIYIIIGLVAAIVVARIAASVWLVNDLHARALARRAGPVAYTPAWGLMGSQSADFINEQRRESAVNMELNRAQALEMGRRG